MWAAGNVTGVRDTRGFFARLPQRLGLSLVLLVFIDVAASGRSARRSCRRLAGTAARAGRRGRPRLVDPALSLPARGRRAVVCHPVLRGAGAAAARARAARSSGPASAWRS